MPWSESKFQQIPFLAVIWFHTPHKPVVSAPPYTDGYEENKDYYGCLTAMDEQMGRLRAELKRLGIEGNTMLWFCSDNGPEGKKQSNKEPGSTNGLRGRKRSLYEGGVRVPGLLVWPDRIKANRTIKMPCSTSDFFPTVLDVLGYQLPEAQTRPYDGVSLLPLIDGKMTDRPRPIGFQSSKQVSLTDNRYKIYREGNAENSFELYDLLEDQNEQTNIANKHPEIVNAMKETLEAWQLSCEKSNQGSSDAPLGSATLGRSLCTTSTVAPW